MANRSSKVIRYRKPFRLNVGLVILIIVFVYMMIQVFLFMTRQHVEIYEVGEAGSIVQNTNYTGLILRDEQVTTAPCAGSLNMYIQNGSRTAVGSVVCSIDQTGDYTKILTDQTESSSLSSNQLAALKKKLSTFSSTYKGENFDQIYDLRSSLQNQLQGYIGSAAISQLSTLDINSSSLTMMNAQVSGVVEYSTDGMESVTEESLTRSSFDSSSYQRNILSSGSTVDQGAPIYKTIADETWYLYLPLVSDDQAALADQSKIRLYFHDANLETDAKFSLFTTSDGTILGKCQLSDYMIELADKRYTSVSVMKSEISSLNISGLKIPESSVVTKDFYCIPLAYGAEGGNSNSVGFYQKSGNGASFIQPSIYAQNDEYYFVEKEDIKEGTILCMPAKDKQAAAGTDEDETEESAADVETSGAAETTETTETTESNDTIETAEEISGEEDIIDTAAASASDMDLAADSADYKIGATASLQGVYSCNRGYADFRAIDILDSNGGYLIVSDSTRYGLCVYDHIVLNGSLVREGELVY